MLGRLLLQCSATASITAETHDGIPLTWNEAVSGILGSISLACWVFLLLPQLYENYTTKSASGLSVAFLLVWFLGDATNFIGAVLADLLPTVIALAVWYIVLDSILIGQTTYYNVTNARKERNKAAQQDILDSAEHGRHQSSASVNEQAPLLRHSSMDLPGSRRRSSAPQQSSSSAVLPALEEIRGPTVTRTVLKNAAALLALCIVGTAAWAIAWAAGVWKPTPPPSSSGIDDTPQDVVAIIFGYASALLYLGARVPQIVKNFRDRSCEGLSLLFFIFSVAGNLTYGLQILFHSLEPRYILLNLPWLIGSLGTIAEDIVIFVQFHIYKKHAIIDD